MSIYVPPRIFPVGPSPLTPSAAKAGPIGPGAGVLNTEYPLRSILGRNDPQTKMRKAWQMGISVPWIRAAERVIAGSCSTVDWHLEDQNDTEIDDEYPGQTEQAARSLLEKPERLIPEDVGRKLTRRELWALTFRHMGLCGNAFWYLDQVNVYGVPLAIRYLRPDRLFPVEDKQGNLIAWEIRNGAGDSEAGVRVPLAQILQFVLDPPDEGHFGIGLVESAILKAENSQATDRHLAMVLAGGGRISGIVSPKQGDSLSPENFQQLVADLRTVVEQPDAAKRLQVLRGPVDFVPTTMSLDEMGIVDLMGKMRDDLLALWGVPLSQIGGTTAAGLNSGETRKYDEAALWQNANHPRLVSFSETLQFGLLDRWEQLGTRIELEIEEPEFDDDSPRFDLLGKSTSAPLRNRERRELVGLDPFGPDVVNPMTGIAIDDEVWLPINMAQAFVAPEDGKVPMPMVQTQPVATGANADASLAAGETMQPGQQMGPGMGKASLRSIHASLVKLRAQMDTTLTPRVKQSVAQVLDEQKRELIARAKGQAEHLMRTRDFSGLWDAPKWDRRMREAMQPSLVGMAELVDGQVRSVLSPQKAGPVTAVEYALNRGGTRITALNQRTRDAVLSVVRNIVGAGIDAGDSPAEVGDNIEAALSTVTLDNGAAAFDELRAETIARTELMAAYNNATLGSYADADITQVEAIDGDGDPECAARNGQTFSLAEAEQIEDHPNGTLDWIPIVEFA